MSEACVRLQQDGMVATVSLERASKLNALTPAMLDELEACDDEVWPHGLARHTRALLVSGLDPEQPLALPPG